MMNICGNLRHLWIGLLLTAPLHAEVKLVAYGEIPAISRDQLGDTVGGLGSAVTADPRSGDVFMMPDRGAGDGTIDYRPRCYRLSIPRSGTHLLPKIEETILFRDQRGRSFTGLLSTDRSAPRNGSRLCLDPEAICAAPDGTLYVSDEYAPALLQFDRSGRLLRTISLPEWYAPRDRNQRLDYRPAPPTVMGRDDNRGAEAMGILPDGRHAVLIFQSALVQDGGRSTGTSRILILDLHTGRAVAEYAYAFADPHPWKLGFADLSVNDLAVVNDHALLVLERDNLGRDGPKNYQAARCKGVWLVDFSRATNLLSLPERPYAQSPGNPAFKPLHRDSPVAFVKKSLVFNLPDLVGQLGLDRKQLAAKWEGLALLPAPSPKSLRLLMTADNDFLTPHPVFNGVTENFPRAKDAVPTQLFEILVPSRGIVSP
jgi:hypothetical protein